MPTLRFGKVWQVIRHFGKFVFCNLGTSKTLFQNLSPRQILLPHIFPYMVAPTMFPVDKKASRRKKVFLESVLIPSTNACYLTIASYGFFWGALTGPYPTLQFGGLWTGGGGVVTSRGLVLIQIPMYPL